MNRRNFIRLFVATTAAISIGGPALAMDTSSEAVTSLGPVMTADNQFLWILAQCLYDFGKQIEAAMGVPRGYSTGRGFCIPTVEQYYNSLKDEYDKRFGLPKPQRYNTLGFALCDTELGTAIAYAGDLDIEIRPRTIDGK